MREVPERVWVPDRWDWREVIVGTGRFKVSHRERVLVEPAHYETQDRPVVVQEGYWKDVERRVLVCDGRWDTVARQELVVPGHWEDRVTTVRVDRGHSHRYASGFEVSTRWSR